MPPSLAVPAFTLILSAIADAGGQLLHLMWQPGAWWVRLRPVHEVPSGGEPDLFIRLRREVQARGGRMYGQGTDGSGQHMSRRFEVTGLGDQVFALSIPVLPPAPCLDLPWQAEEAA